MKIYISYLVMDDNGYVDALWFSSGQKTKEDALSIGRKMQKKFEKYNIGIRVKKLGIFDMAVN